MDYQLLELCIAVTCYRAYDLYFKLHKELVCKLIKEDGVPYFVENDNFGEKVIVTPNDNPH